MPTYRLRDFGRALEILLLDLVPAVVAAVRDEVAVEAQAEVVERSPVGGAADAHPGKYRASHVVSHSTKKTVVLPDMAGYPIPGEAEARAGLAGAPPGAVAFVANAAAPERRPSQSYAAILEGGRRQYSRRAAGRPQWIGSTQAPDGVYGPTVPALLARRATIVRNALARIKGRLKK